VWHVGQHGWQDSKACRQAINSGRTSRLVGHQGLQGSKAARQASKACRKTRPVCRPAVMAALQAILTGHQC
jgi:hypothetical protein